MTKAILEPDTELRDEGTKTPGDTDATTTDNRTPAKTRKTGLDRWEIPALIGILVVTAVAYLWNLAASGWANSFYAAAVQAGSVSWKAAFFGSSDAANSITVDKTPASLWVMELSVRIFGLSTWSMLAPEVLLMVGTVIVTWATVRRSFGPAAGLLSGVLLALTPIAAVMFRYNNPDALLVFLMAVSAWAMVRAVSDGRWRWLVVCGAAIGFGFLTKQMQVFLILPALVLTYFFAGPPKFWKRTLQLVAALGSLLVAAGWWVVIAEIWPTNNRPWVGGSQKNSIMDLTLGYNGLGRLSGNEHGGMPGMGGGHPGGGGHGFGGASGITRMFQAQQEGQIAWLIPAALVALLAGLVLCGKRTRTDGQRAQLVLFGLWAVVSTVVLSYMNGIFHPYYTVAMAPAIAALAAIGAVLAWRHREVLWVRLAAALAIALTGALAWQTLARTPHFLPWLRWAIVIVAVVAAFGTAASSGLLSAMKLPARLDPRIVTAVLAGFVLLAGPVAYTADTVGSTASGGMPSAGPQIPGQHGPFGPGNNPVNRNPGGGAGGNRIGNHVDNGQQPVGAPGGPGGFGRNQKPSARLIGMLQADGGKYTWAAATVSANNAAGYQLGSQLPVMPVGGFSGGDPSPTLSQFQQDVAQGKVHYFLVNTGGPGGNRGGGSNNSASSQITQWVQKTYRAQVIDGVTVYDLTAPPTPAAG